MTSAAHLDTRAVHAGREDLAGLGVHAAPIDLSTTNPLPNVHAGGDSYEMLAGGGTPGCSDPAAATGGAGGAQSAVYQRLWNPTVGRFEQALAAMEGTDESVAFASGMAALSACLLAAGSEGNRHIVAVRPLYGGSDHMLETGLLGTEISWAAADGIAEALRPDTVMVIVETPANPGLQLLDLTAVRAQCGDVPLLVDNTFATPVLQNPLRQGATLVLHSATKFLGGHGDVLGGIVATGADWAARLRRVRAITGGILHPLAGYLLHRGLQTLPTRVRAQQETAGKIANWLRDHPGIARVAYPGLPERDPAGLVGTQMSGAGSVLSFEITGGGEPAASVADTCRLITHAVSLGGVDSLIQHPASLTHRPVTDHAKPAVGLLRLSVGLEDPQDLVADLEQALAVATS